jgi:hypothetical protein
VLESVRENISRALDRLFWHIAASEYEKADAQLELIAELATRLEKAG